VHEAPLKQLPCLILVAALALLTSPASLGRPGRDRCFIVQSGTQVAREVWSWGPSSASLPSALRLTSQRPRSHGRRSLERRIIQSEGPSIRLAVPVWPTDNTPSDRPKRMFWYWKQEPAQVSIDGNNGHRSVSLRLSSSEDGTVLTGEFSLGYDFRHERYWDPVRLVAVDCSWLTRAREGEVWHVGPRGPGPTLVPQPERQ